MTPGFSLFAALPDGGRIPATREVLEAPLPVSREGGGCGLTHGDLFRALEGLLGADNRALLKQALEALSASPPPARSAVSLIAEKHGAFYHPARIHLETEQGGLDLAANLAFSRAGRAMAKREFGLLQALCRDASARYLPRALGFAESRDAALLLTEWLSGYCEFHLSRAEKGKGPEIRLWDGERGHRFLSTREAREVYAGAAEILSYYFDPESLELIHPWHHAAGDFVARAEAGGMSVRLITARGYSPLFGEPDGTLEGALAPALYFLTDLTLRLRLDRLDGTGDLIMAGEEVIPPLVAGFFRGLAQREKDTGKGRDLAALLRAGASAIGQNEILEMGNEILDACSRQSPDTPVLREALEGHAKALARALSGSKPPGIWG